MRRSQRGGHSNHLGFKVLSENNNQNISEAQGKAWVSNKRGGRRRRRRSRRRRRRRGGKWYKPWTWFTRKSLSPPTKYQSETNATSKFDPGLMAPVGKKLTDHDVRRYAAAVHTAAHRQPARRPHQASPPIGGRRKRSRKRRRRRRRKSRRRKSRN